MSRRRQLSDDELALWDGVVRSIKPLRGIRKKAAAVAKVADGKVVDRKVAEDVALPRTKTRQRDPAPQVPVVPAKPKPAPLEPLGRRLKQRVARGRETIDARIDLHGLTQAEAHGALLHFLHSAQARGARIVLVVTGKGRAKDDDDRDSTRGVLRRQVPLWLALPDFRSFVIGFEDAHVGHGGEGALYVRLRRQR